MERNRDGEPPARATASASLATWVTSWASSAKVAVGASSRAAGSARANPMSPRRLIGQDREVITNFPCPCSMDADCLWKSSVECRDERVDVAAVLRDVALEDAALEVAQGK